MIALDRVVTDDYVVYTLSSAHTMRLCLQSVSFIMMKMKDDGSVRVMRQMDIIMLEGESNQPLRTRSSMSEVKEYVTQ